MSTINYVARLKAFKENCGNPEAILTVLIDYKKLFPEMEQDSEYFTVDVLCAYLRQIRHAEKNDQELLMTSSLTFYAALPMNIAHEIVPTEAGYISSSNLRIGQLANIENYYNFIKLRDFPEAELDDAFFETNLKKLEAILIPRNLEMFDFSFPMGQKFIKLEREADVEFIFQNFSITPVLCVFNYALEGVTGSFGCMVHPSLNLCLNNEKFLRSSDLGIFHGHELLVNIEVEFPFSKKALFNTSGHHFTRLLTQTFYNGVAGGTPYMVISDYEHMILLEICLRRDQEELEAELIGEEGVMKMENVGVPLYIRYRLIHRRDSRLTMFVTFLAFVYAAYDRLIVKGEKEEVKKHLLKLASKLKLTENHKQMKMLQELPQLKAKTKAIFSELSRSGANYQFSDVASEMSNWTELSVTTIEGARHSQVYQNIETGSIIKIYDPSRSPSNTAGEEFQMEARKKIAFESFKTELTVYSQVKHLPAAESVTPNLLSQGFIQLTGNDFSYGPFIEMEDVGGEPPCMDSFDDVELILTAYRSLLEAGVVHGDIKVSNIRLVNDRTRAILFDFGFSLISNAVVKKGKKFVFLEACSTRREDIQKLKVCFDRDLSDAREQLPVEEKFSIGSEFHDMFEVYFSHRSSWR